MNELPMIHLCIQQPAGYVHSLGLVDQARYFRHQFRRLGATVSMAKNRLRHGAVNFVFGAHLGFDAEQRDRHACIFVNLEQLGEGGASVSPEYRELLASSAVVDYDTLNVPAYSQYPEDVPVVPLLHAPYLKPACALPLEERPIDLLFIGSMNPRRTEWLARIEALGLSVATFDGPLYGAERDDYILQAKAVVNAHFYETSRFEQARVAHCLSLGTPVISERTALTRPHPGFEDCVFWLESDAQLEQFFAEDFATPAFFDLARLALERFEQFDPIEAYADLLAFAVGFGKAQGERRAVPPFRPATLNAGSGPTYLPGWLNIDADGRDDPDLVLDLTQPLVLPLSATTSTLGPLTIEPQSFSTIRLGDRIARDARLPVAMGNCLQLLEPGGELLLELQHHDAMSALQPFGQMGPLGLVGPVLAAQPATWHPFCEGFCDLGWFEHRFELLQVASLDRAARPCRPDEAAATLVLMRKIQTSMRERTLARTVQADLRLPDDEVSPAPAADGAPLSMPAPMPMPMPMPLSKPAPLPLPMAAAPAPVTPAAGRGEMTMVLTLKPSQDPPPVVRRLELPASRAA